MAESGNAAAEAPLVSVLIPCHNAAPWLPAALASVRRQDWPRIETVVVDDGSTDASGEVLRDLAGPDVRVLRQARA